jgi:hypothetical protein
MQPGGEGDASRPGVRLGAADDQSVHNY